ncbi:MAG: TlpA family protein disulfide reductase [Dehalococcoidia bacterium]|nr:MAG: TlpA family protein disulfide reductase [Dehalococcoidia bacterium]
MKNIWHTTARHTAAILILVGALLAVAGCSGGGDNPPAPPTAPADIGLQEVQVRAPDFTLPTLGGGEVVLSDLQGQIVLLNFWQLNCPPCKEEMPLLDAVGKAYAGTAHVVALDIGDGESDVQEYFGDATLNMFVPLDGDGRVAAEYSIGFTPTTFLIDSEGIVRFVKVGPFASYTELAAAIEFTRLKESA